MEPTSVSGTLGPQVLGALGNSSVNQLTTRYRCISNALRQTHSLPHTQTSPVVCPSLSWDQCGRGEVGYRHQAGMVSACLELGILLEDRSGTKEIGAMNLGPPQKPTEARGTWAVRALGDQEG